MAGLAIFAVASLLGGLATNEGLLLGARASRVSGPHWRPPAALALITTTFPAGPAGTAPSPCTQPCRAPCGRRPDPRRLADRTSPEIFGVVVDGWRFTFLINVPIGLAAAALAPRFLNESESHPGELDLPSRHRHPGPARRGLRTDPSRQRGLGGLPHHRQPRGRRRAAGRLRPRREPRRAPRSCLSASSPTALAAASFVAMFLARPPCSRCSTSSASTSRT